jgi:hypothetical protein
MTEKNKINKYKESLYSRQYQNRSEEELEKLRYLQKKETSMQDN